MLRLTKAGGLVVMTCASQGRPEHGTRRSDECSAPLAVQVGWQDYYKNLTSDDFIKTFNLKGWFEGFHFLFNATTMDLCFYGIKKGGNISYADLYQVLMASQEFNSKHIYGWLQTTGDVINMHGKTDNAFLWTNM